jgi:RNA polymerase sigma factor (sigma-70 family)
MPTRGSVTRLIDDLRASDSEIRDAAAEKIWSRYAQQLLERARVKLAARIRRRVDEEDVLQSMYKSFFRRLRHGEYAFKDRRDILNLLVTMTLRKSYDAANRHEREGRDVRREAPGHAAAESGSVVELVSMVPSDGPTAEQTAAFNDALEQLLNMLPDDRVRELVLWKIEGYTNEEVAEKQGCAVRTVERKLSLVRERWLELAGG